MASEAASEVATVYTLPAKDVTTPAPEVARVIASPPALVMIVNAEPAMLVTSVAIAPPTKMQNEKSRSLYVRLKSTHHW